jgi:hypothetical protein
VVCLPRPAGRRRLDALQLSDPHPHCIRIGRTRSLKQTAASSYFKPQAGVSARLLVVLGVQLLPSETLKRPRRKPATVVNSKILALLSYCVRCSPSGG